MGRALAGVPPKKGDPPGGTTGRVGFSTGVDEAPVLDANIHDKSVFERKWSSGSREKNASNKKRRCQGLNQGA